MGTAVNAGGGLANCVSLVELIEVMLKLKIKFNKPAHAEWRQGDQKIFCSDNSLAKQLLGWEPSTPSSIGIEKLWNWVSSNKEEIYKLLKSKN